MSVNLVAPPEYTGAYGPPLVVERYDLRLVGLPAAADQLSDTCQSPGVAARLAGVNGGDCAKTPPGLSAIAIVSR